MTPDKTKIKTFFNALYKADDPKITWAFFKDPEGETGAKPAYYGTVDEAWNEILDAVKKEMGVFFMVNRSYKAEATDAELRDCAAVFIDIDGKLADGKQAHLPIYWHTKPDIICTRSDGNGFHVYWCLDEKETDIDKHLDVQTKLQDFYKSYGADPKILSRSRVMRVPHTPHQKDRTNIKQYEARYDA